MQAEPGETIERRSGTRAAKPPRKGPSASPGTKTRGRTKSILVVIDIRKALLEPSCGSQPSLAVVERRRERELAGRRLDGERQDRNRRERAPGLLAEHDGLGARDERSLRQGAL